MRGRWLLAASLLIPAAAPAQKVPPRPFAVSDEKLYRDAMECKVHLEALVPHARKKRERKIFSEALAFFVEDERTTAAKLGKGDMEVLKDEALFGLAAADSPDLRVRIDLCLKAFAWSRRYR